MAIAHQASAKSFGGTALYLERGRGARVDPANRVDWIETRHLTGIEDPEDIDLAARLMEASAAESDLQEPAYHVSISFHPDDRPQLDQAAMSRFVDDVLERMGLSEHQCLVVAHKDTDHPHVHLLINRVHPDHLRAWRRWEDRPRMQKALRHLEREHGLTETPGYLYQLPGQEPPNPELGRTIGEARRGRKEFAEELRGRGVGEDLRAATSWLNLETRLDRHGLSLQPAGRGLQLVDAAEQTAKPSRLDRQSSLAHLEQRFDERYRDYRAREPQRRQRALREPTTRRSPAAPRPARPYPAKVGQAEADVRKSFAQVLQRAGVGDDLRDATSWKDLEAHLEKRGLHLRPAGRGLQISDGHGLAAKPSALDRGSSRTRLGRRFGEPYRARQNRPVPHDLPRPGRYPRVVGISSQRADVDLMTQLQTSVDRARATRVHKSFAAQQARTHQERPVVRPNTVVRQRAAATKGRDTSFYVQDRTYQETVHLLTRLVSFEHGEAELLKGADGPTTHELKYKLKECRRGELNAVWSIGESSRDPQATARALRLAGAGRPAAEKKYIPLRGDGNVEEVYRQVIENPEQLGLKGRNTLGRRNAMRKWAIDKTQGAAKQALHCRAERRELQQTLQEARARQEHWRELRAKLRTLSGVRPDQPPDTAKLLEELQRRTEGDDLGKFAHNPKWLDFLKGIRDGEARYLFPIRAAVKNMLAAGADENEMRYLAAAQKVARLAQAISPLWPVAPRWVEGCLTASERQTVRQAIQLAQSLVRGVSRGLSPSGSL